MSKLLGIMAGILLSLSLFTTADARVDNPKYAYATGTVIVTPVVAHRHYYRHRDGDHWRNRDPYYWRNHDGYYWRNHGYYWRHNHWYHRHR